MIRLRVTRPRCVRFGCRPYAMPCLLTPIRQAASLCRVLCANRMDMDDSRVRSASSSLAEADLPRDGLNCALSACTTGVERNVMAAPNIGHSVIRIVNIFVVIILILILLNLLGQPISNAIPSAAQSARDMLAALRNGTKDLVPNNWNNYFYHHH
jgi:hypothetical protein